MNARLTQEQIRIIDEIHQETTVNSRNRIACKYFGSPIGRGSSRYAYKIDDTHCLKIAVSPAGVDQNQKESTRKFKNHPLMAQLYDVASDYSWVIMELCEAVTNPSIASVLSIDTNEPECDFCSFGFEFFQHVVGYIVNLRPKLPRWMENNYMTILQHSQTVNYARAVSPKLDKFLTTFEEWDSRYKPSTYLLSDLERPENWGIASRDGERTFVAIDYGFDATVWSKYYR